MNPLLSESLEDVQNQTDHRGVPIDEVGIADLRYPVRVAGRDGDVQSTVATLAATVDLAADLKGTHMSRFLEAVAADLTVVDALSCAEFAQRLRSRLDSSRARLELRFPYFLQRTAPVSGLAGLVDFDATVIVESSVTTEVRLGVRVPVTSLCPCSREISDYGAHNQRGYVEVEVLCDPGADLWFEDLIEMADAAASAPIYSLLKRVDERHVTMAAYENPAFVEDIAREVVMALRADSRVAEFVVRVRNLESIHNHSAMATVRGRRAA